MSFDGVQCSKDSETGQLILRRPDGCEDIRLKLASQQWVVGAECIGIALGALLLARERLVLFVGAVGFCAVSFLMAIAVTHDRHAIVGLLISGIVLVVFGRFAKTYKPSYGWPEGSIAELVVGLTSLLLTLRAFTLIDR